MAPENEEKGIALTSGPLVLLLEAVGGFVPLSNGFCPSRPLRHFYRVPPLVYFAARCGARLITL